MKKLTKIMIIVLSLVLVVGCFGIFAACKKDGGSSDDDNFSWGSYPTATSDGFVNTPNSWGDALLLIAKMNDLGWFGNNFAGIGHSSTLTAFAKGNALFCIEGSWSRGGLAGTNGWNNTISIPLPAVSAGFIYDGSPAGNASQGVVGGVTAGWQVSKNAWGEDGASAKAKAAVAFVDHMTKNSVIEMWAPAGGSVNPLKSVSEGQIASNLWQQSVASMLGVGDYSDNEVDVVTAMDARVSPAGISAYRAAMNDITKSKTKLSEVAAVLADVKAENKANASPFLTYAAPTAKGATAIPTNDDITSETTLNVYTMFPAQVGDDENSGDWQHGPFMTGLNANAGANYKNTTVEVAGMLFQAVDEDMTYGATVAEWGRVDGDLNALTETGVKGAQWTRTAAQLVALDNDDDFVAETDLPTVGNWFWGVECGIPFSEAFPNVTVTTTADKATNAIKDAKHAAWATASAMPDVLAWFSDASASAIRKDTHLVSVADIQKVYGKYGENMQEQYLDKYAIPIVGTFESVFVNVELLVEFAPTGADKTALVNALAKEIGAGDGQISELQWSQGVLAAALKLVDTWAEIAALADAATAAGVIAFSQDRTEEPNYLLDQAVMACGGIPAFVAVPGVAA